MWRVSGRQAFWPDWRSRPRDFHRRKIAADGIVGKVTWINIDEADQSEPVLKIGSTGLPVRRAQKRMSLVVACGSRLRSFISGRSEIVKRDN